MIPSTLFALVGIFSSLVAVNSAVIERDGTYVSGLRCPKHYHCDDELAVVRYDFHPVDYLQCDVHAVDDANQYQHYFNNHQFGDHHDLSLYDVDSVDYPDYHYLLVRLRPPLRVLCVPRRPHRPLALAL
ncbi:hypothetical protein J3R83DRAFT_10614 [Lanmaoa asiatica]|nr:hypothetical protein J3R83DRAFT_10614 [Lanmaoa asiatica]